jgi:hypothetical protein
MIESIESNGKKYPILTNTYVFGKLQFETGFGVDAIALLEEKLWLFEPLIWYSLVQGHLVAKEPLELTREDMPVFLSDDNVYLDYVKLLPKFLTVKDKTKNAGEDSGIKKK